MCCSWRTQCVCQLLAVGPKRQRPGCAHARCALSPRPPPLQPAHLPAAPPLLVIGQVATQLHEVLLAAVEHLGAVMGAARGAELAASRVRKRSAARMRTHARRTCSFCAPSSVVRGSWELAARTGGARGRRDAASPPSERAEESVVAMACAFGLAGHCNGFEDPTSIAPELRCDALCAGRGPGAKYWSGVSGACRRAYAVDQGVVLLWTKRVVRGYRAGGGRGRQLGERCGAARRRHRRGEVPSNEASCRAAQRHTAALNGLPLPCARDPPPPRLPRRGPW